ncbi:MAG: hypothetical protein HY777_08715 [Betaproteobacteria bacterium]|nr:hypothetical protein [Betaproteobacteria bacterium]
MEWEFSAEDVVKARAEYGLADFRRDLVEEIRLNLGATGETLTRSFNLIYDLCYALATHKDLEKFLSAYAYDPPTVQFLREVEPMMAGNVEMLGAILQRQIMERVESGMAIEQAVEDTAKWHVGAVRVAVGVATD